MNKILVIEDSVEVLDNIQQILELEGFLVITAANGSIGIEQAKQNCPDLIICDVMMPEVDGYGVLVALQQNITTSQIPFIFLTAKAEHQSVRQGIELGADDYLTKPFNPDELLRAIAIRLRKKSFAKQHYTQQLQQEIEAARQNLPFSTPSLSLEEIAIANALRQTLESPESNQLLLYYQPQVDLKTGEIIGAEALVRWQHPEYGFLFPDKFIPIAETTGLIVPLGNLVLQLACQQTKKWQSIRNNLSISVNVSAHQFSDANLKLTVQKVIRDNNLNANLLDLEITETTLIQDPQLTNDILNIFRSLGARVSIDDFGIGYSSLSYLQKFSLDTIKIDRSFVSNVDTNTGNAAIVQAVIEMAHKLNFNIVAEGVETRAELNFLRQHNCDIIQGYLFSKPLPVHEFEQLLISGRKLD
ncbi:EAL domain-containing response regulator [Pseudanabaena sp. Chao 1811]|uniref:EAL domain-containing response regulator n=1 Tax=Pseudanabaena sp. Chao 1811 TaxID=2963092 RepID=UPI0022F3F824|nr:EAL domain-containing response regulator [Pseudanabaena sp. Chao 1811]